MTIGVQMCPAEAKLAGNEMEVGVWKFRGWRVTFPRPAVAISNNSFCWKQEEH